MRRSSVPVRSALRGPAIAILALGVALGAAASAAAQQPGPSIPELERFLAERDGNIARSEARLARLEAVGDSLVRAKRRADPGSAQYERISNQILENSDQIQPLQRDLRQLHSEARELRQTLFVRFNNAIAETNQRIEELRRQGRTPERSPELRQLIDALPGYYAAHARYEAAVAEQECAPWLPDLILLADDGPSQLRYKEALARDAVDKIDACIGGIEKQIEEKIQKRRIRQEAERLRGDLERWGDQRSVKAGNDIDAILENRVAGEGRPGTLNPFEDPDARIRELQRRRLDLVERRDEFETKARWFAQRLREFYP